MQHQEILLQPISKSLQGENTRMLSQFLTMQTGAVLSLLRCLWITALTGKPCFAVRIHVTSQLCNNYFRILTFSLGRKWKMVMCLFSFLSIYQADLSHSQFIPSFTDVQCLLSGSQHINSELHCG